MLKVSSFSLGLNSLSIFHTEDNFSKDDQKPLASPAKKAAPNAVVSVVLGRITFTPSKLDCICIKRLLLLAPPSTFKDLNLDFARNTVTNDVVKIEDVEAIKRSVRNLVNTNFYERPFHPELGCGVRQLLFEPFTPVTSIFIKRKVEEVITNYEPRARLDQVIVTETPDRNAIEVRVVFYCMNIANPVTVLTTLQRIR